MDIEFRSEVYSLYIRLCYNEENIGNSSSIDFSSRDGSTSAAANIGVINYTTKAPVYYVNNHKSGG